MKKGFASTIAAVLAALAIAVAVSYALSASFLEQVSLASTESRLVAQGFGDAKAFFEASVNDALLDSAYQTCGCSASNASGLNATIWRLVPQYLGNSSLALSYGAFNVNYTSLSMPSFSVSSCNATLTGTFSYQVNATTYNARIMSVVSQSKTIGIEKNSTAVSLNVSNSTALVANFTISCA